MKGLLNSVSIRYEELCRIIGSYLPQTPADNTLQDLYNSYHTQSNPIIDKRSKSETTLCETNTNIYIQTRMV